MKLSDEPKTHGAIGFWEKIPGVNDTPGFFAIAQHVEISGIQTETEDGTYLRCDSNSRKGPQGFHKWLGTSCTCGSNEKPHGLTGHHHVRFDNMIAIFPIIEAVPYGHIMYFELDNQEDEIATIEGFHTEHARTLQEIFRLLLEWDFAYTELGSREPVAVVSHGMVEVLDIPQSIKDWIINNIPAEKIGRYLRGDANARVRTTETIPPLSDEFSEWLYGKISTTRAIGTYDSNEGANNANTQIPSSG